MKKFEDFFKEYRLRLDTENIEKDTWERIERSFSKHKRNKSIKYLKIAASIFLIISILIIGFTTIISKKTKNIEPFLAKYSKKLGKKEMSYIEKINLQLEQIRKTDIYYEDISFFDEFKQELNELDKQYNELKYTLSREGYSETIVEQMVYIYQLKLELLKMLQQEIEKINNILKEQNHENKAIHMDI